MVLEQRFERRLGRRGRLVASAADWVRLRRSLSRQASFGVRRRGLSASLLGWSGYLGSAEGALGCDWVWTMLMSSESCGRVRRGRKDSASWILGRRGRCCSSRLLLRSLGLARERALRPKAGGCCIRDLTEDAMGCDCARKKLMSSSSCGRVQRGRKNSARWILGRRGRTSSSGLLLRSLGLARECALGPTAGG